MAKRRHAKKEKAERNRINARKFRQASSRYSGKRRRYFHSTQESKEKKSSEAVFNQSSSSEENVSKD